MRLIELPGIWTVLLDFAAWFVIQLGVSLMTLHLPDRLFKQDGFFYRSYPWEQSGEIWQTVFRVRSWKNRLPDGAQIIKKGFAKKHLQSLDAEFLAAFIRESRRAELTHSLIMPFALLFFLWNPPAVGGFMVVFAVVTNAPYVIAQRYNRPRFQRVLKRRF